MKKTAAYRAYDSLYTDMKEKTARLLTMLKIVQTKILCPYMTRFFIITKTVFS